MRVREISVNRVTHWQNPYNSAVVCSKVTCPTPRDVISCSGGKFENSWVRFSFSSSIFINNLGFTLSGLMACQLCYQHSLVHLHYTLFLTNIIWKCIKTRVDQGHMATGSRLPVSTRPQNGRNVYRVTYQLCYPSSVTQLTGSNTVDNVARFHCDSLCL